MQNYRMFWDSDLEKLLGMKRELQCKHTGVFRKDGHDDIYDGTHSINSDEQYILVRVVVQPKEME